MNNKGEDMKKKYLKGKYPNINVFLANKESDFIPSKYQKAIFDGVKNGKGNMLVDAKAGSGKTRSLLEVCKLLPVYILCIFVFFNKILKAEISKKLPKHIEASTLHGRGYHLLCQRGIKPVVDKNKVDTIILDILKEFGGTDKVFEDKQDLIVYRDKQRRRKKKILRDNGEDSEVILIEYLKKVVSKIKKTMCPLTVDDINEIPNFFEKCTPFRLELIKKILDKDMDMLSIVDYDDMLWIPVRKQFDSIDILPTLKHWGFQRLTTMDYPYIVLASTIPLALCLVRNVEAESPQA